MQSTDTGRARLLRQMERADGGMSAAGARGRGGLRQVQGNVALYMVERGQ